jgi:RHS repeat-associated protein
MQLRQRAGCPQRRARDREQPSALTSTLTTEALGNPVAQWGSTANPYRFAGAWGYRDDGDAGLLYVGARYYEPAVGRWTSADKWLGDIYRPLSLNRYLYCEDEPVNYVDPSGRVPIMPFVALAVLAVLLSGCDKPNNFTGPPPRKPKPGEWYPEGSGLPDPYPPGDPWAQSIRFEVPVMWRSGILLM